MAETGASDVAALYQQIVLEHSRAPRNFGALPAPTHSAQGHNPLCGDALQVDVDIVDACIAAIGFRGEACAITRATASLLSERVHAMSPATVADLEVRFTRMIHGEIPGDAMLLDLNALAALAHYPTRRKCALLPFATLRAALAGIARTTTEGIPVMSHPQSASATQAIAFRRADVADVPAIVSLVTSAYRGESSRAGWTTEADLLDGQRIDPAGVIETITTPDSRIILAERGQRLLASCHIEKDGLGCYFGMFAVDPALQGGGVGKRMMVEAERAAREEFGCEQMEMTVISVRDELIAWYERRGYRRTGKYKPFPYGDERFGIPKRDDLRFEFLVKAL